MVSFDQYQLKWAVRGRLAEMFEDCSDENNGTLMPGCPQPTLPRLSTVPRETYGVDNVFSVGLISSPFVTFSQSDFTRTKDPA